MPSGGITNRFHLHLQKESLLYCAGQNLALNALFPETLLIAKPLKWLQATVTHVKTKSTHPFPLLAPSSPPKQNFKMTDKRGLLGFFSHCRSVTRVINKTPFTEIDSLKQNYISANTQNLLADGNSGTTPKRLSVIKEKQKKNKKPHKG